MIGSRKGVREQKGCQETPGTFLGTVTTNMARRLHHKLAKFLIRPCTLIVTLLIVAWYLKFLLTRVTLDSKYHGVDHAAQLLALAVLWPIATMGLVRL